MCLLRARFRALEGSLFNTGGTWDEDVAENDKKKCTNNLGWKVASLFSFSLAHTRFLSPFPSSSVSIWRRELAAKRTPLSLFHSFLHDKEHALEGYRTSRGPGPLFLPPHLPHLAYILRRGCPFISGFSPRVSFSLLQIAPAICKSSPRLLGARSIWLFRMVS